MALPTTFPNRVLITGASGFAGSHLAQRLLREGCFVRCVQHSKPLPAFLQHAEAVSADLRDAAAVTAAAAGVSAVFHLAGMAAVGDADGDPAAACLVNTLGTLNILEAARKAGVASVALLSTAHVYGPPVALPVTEDHPLNPISVYAASKLAGEVMALGYARSFSLPVTILRSFNIYGPRQRPIAVIPSVIRQALETGTVQVTSTTPRRDFLYVDDVVDALIRSAITPAATGQAINLASGNPVSIGEIVRRVLDLVSGLSPEEPAEEEFGPGPDCVFGSSWKARDLLGWEPSVPLNEGLARTIAWWRSAVTNTPSEDS